MTLTDKIEHCGSGECSAPIVWARTTSGRSLPVNAKPSEDGNIVLENRQGFAHAIVYPTPIQGGHTSHFVTCPAAKERRKPQ